MRYTVFAKLRLFVAALVVALLSFGIGRCVGTTARRTTEIACLLHTDTAVGPVTVARRGLTYRFVDAQTGAHVVVDGPCRLRVLRP